MPNTRSTRSRRRSASQSQSQSQSQSLRRTNKRKASKQAKDDVKPVQGSFASASTASLPPNHTIHLALPVGTNLDQEEELAYHVKGQELLADGWRRKEAEGELSELRAAQKAIRHGRHGAPRPDVLWYSASLKYPCTCELKPSRRAWTVAAPPPTVADLPNLSPDPSHAALLGDAIPEWTNNPSKDLDPTVESLLDFTHDWNQLASTTYNQRLNLPSSPRSATTVVEDPSESIEARRIRKGKFKAETTHSTLTIIPSSPAAKHLDQGDRIRAKDYALLARKPLQSSQSANVLVPTSSEDDQEERTKRKAWWRAQIRSDEGYGRFWKIIPRPHALDYHPSSRRPKRKKGDPRVPDFVLPKYYSSPTARHPFHPRLREWIAQNPRERVCWIVPLHGPVHVSKYADPTTSPPPLAPVPSTATLRTKMPIARPKEIDWSDALLKHFWEAFLGPLQSDPRRSFGDLSVRLSGPKPDPFINFPPQPRLASSASQKGLWTGPTVEVGDHIRVYLDAKYALRFRTWLRGVEVDPRYLGTGVTKEEMIRPFLKVRLVLVTLSGQALIVA